MLANNRGEGAVIGLLLVGKKTLVQILPCAHFFPQILNQSSGNYPKVMSRVILCSLLMHEKSWERKVFSKLETFVLRGFFVH